MGHFTGFRLAKIIVTFAYFVQAKNFDKIPLVKTVCLDKYY